MCQCGNRFDPNTHYHWLSIGDASFYASRIVRQVGPGTISIVAQDVMDLGTGCTRGTEARTNLHSLCRWDAHHCQAQASTQATIPLTEAAKANWYTESDYLKDTSTGITVALRFQNTLNHFLCQCNICTTHR